MSHACEQLAEGRYPAVERRLEVKLATSQVASQHLNHYTTKPRHINKHPDKVFS